MEEVTLRLLRLAAIWFPLLAAGGVAYRALMGGVILRGLLRDKFDGAPSPGRFQLLIATLVAAGYYTTEAFQTPGSELPVPSEYVLALAGGSQGFYLAGKSFSLWRLLARTRA